MPRKPLRAAAAPDQGIFWMIGRPDSIITDFLPPATADAFAELPHWTTIKRSYGIGQAGRSS